MKKTSRFLSAALAGIMVLSMAACSSKTSEPATSGAADTAAETSSGASGTEEASKEAAADGKEYKIGVLQLVQHGALDAANQGFIAALDESGIQYKAEQQNASNDQSTCQTIAQQFVNDKKDLILAIATPAAQAVAGATSEIPILVTAVTDPADAGLVDSNEAPGVNVSGTSDLNPVNKQVDLIKQIIPDVKTVGILYCSAESNSVLQANMAKEAMKNLGIEGVDYTVSSSNEIQTVVESMVGKVDAIYAPTDNMIAAGMPTVSMIATDNKLPIICGEEGMVEAGGLATYGINYYEIGYLAGQQAVKILTEGADITKMPVEYMPEEKCELTVNQETADKLGIDVSDLQ